MKPQAAKQQCNLGTGVDRGLAAGRWQQRRNYVMTDLQTFIFVAVVVRYSQLLELLRYLFGQLTSTYLDSSQLLYGTND